MSKDRNIPDSQDKAQTTSMPGRRSSSADSADVTDSTQASQPAGNLAVQRQFRMDGQGQGGNMLTPRPVTFGQWLWSLDNQAAPAPDKTTTSDPLAATDMPDSAQASITTVPLTSLFQVPERQSLQTLFSEAVADPDDAQESAQEIAANNTLAEYFEDKLTWPVQIERQYGPDGSERYTFSVYGEDLVCTTQPRLPVESFDSVSYEPLRVVNDRIAAQTFQVVTAAMLQVAYAPLAEEDLPLQVEKNPEDYAFNYVVQQKELANALSDRADLLMRTLDPSNEWLRYSFGVQLQQIHAYRDRMRKATGVAYDFLHDDAPSKEAGEIYDENIKDVEEDGGVKGFFGGGFLRLGKLIGNIVTGGGQSLNAQNAQMYRRGEISYSAFKINRLLNIGRVGINAVVTAATAGRASGAAMSFLGLEAGTTLAAVTTTATVEGMAQGLTQAFSSDAYAYVVSKVSSDPGVSAFHDATIGGPTAWLESTAWGGVIGGGSAVLGSLIPKTPFDQSKLQSEMSPESVPGEETSGGWRIIDADEQAGTVTLSIPHPATGELLIMEGDAAGNGVVTNVATGEVVGYYNEGQFSRASSGGTSAASGDVAAPGPGGAAVDETGLLSVSDDTSPSPLLSPPHVPDIEAMIREEMTPFEPPASLYPVEDVGLPEPAPTTWEEALDRVDVGKIPSARLDELKNDYANYRKNWKPGGAGRRPLTEGEYVRVRSGQFVRPLTPLEPKFASEVGRVAEKTWAEAVQSPRNPGVAEGGRFNTPWGNVEPDFMPAAGASGEIEFARNAGYAAQHGLPGIGDALLVADSKYFGVFQNVEVITITDQIRGMIWLSRATQSRTFVALIRPGQRLSQGILDFAQQYQVNVETQTHVNVQ